MGAASITVVIPTRNRLALLQEAVRSVRSQTYAARIIVVDDSSDDGTWPWLDSQMDASLGAIRLTSRAERSMARNRGLAAVSTDFVMFLDDDDLLRVDALGRLASAIANHPDAVAAAGATEYFDADGRRLRSTHPRRVLKRNVWCESVFGLVLHAGRVLLRTSSVRETGGFAPDLIVGEDRDLWLRLSRLGPMVFVPEVVLDHRMHAGQWRPRDVGETEEALTRRHLSSVEPARRALGERVLQAKMAMDKAGAEWSTVAPSSALRNFLALRAAPRQILFSPFYRRSWLVPLAKLSARFVLRDRGTRAVLKLKAARRSILSRDRWKVPLPEETGEPTP